MSNGFKTVESLTQEELRGKRVLVRVGFDVPLENGEVQSDFRIREALPTLELLRAGGAKIILLSHIGRNPETSLAPVAKALEKFLPVTFLSTLIGPEVDEKLQNLSEGEILFLENLRSNPGEEANDEAFANTLAGYGELYVNEAFSVSHRAHASIVGIPKFLPSYAGISFKKEVTELTKALTPEEPSLFILGGAKFDTKLALIEKFLPVYNRLFVGGALAHDLWKARGMSVGKSLVSDVDLSSSELAHNDKILLPIDVLVRNEKGEERITIPTEVAADENILDCGPKTVAYLGMLAFTTRTILWNGTLGNYENGYEKGTQDLAQALVNTKAFSIVGGGDTVASLESLGIGEKFGFVSTGGGAMLTFLEAGTLPGIEALLSSK